ncbi:MAG: hypothetical protein JWM28_2764 [Chitinophagaceae bacterium]|nr:hypothetical protein [Chitinophagaceae bacterium]
MRMFYKTVMLEVKKYVKPIFGTTSPQFKHVGGLEITNVKDR